MARKECRHRMQARERCGASYAPERLPPTSKQRLGFEEMVAEGEWMRKPLTGVPGAWHHLYQSHV
jgi:hypothetical protein